MEKYEQPGVKINSKPPSKEYKDNYDSIFGKKESWLDRRLRKEKEQQEHLERVNNLSISSFVQERKEKEKLHTQEREVENDKIKHDNCTD